MTALTELLQSRRAFHVAIALSVVALSAAILAPPYLPFTDAAEHAAVMATLRNWGDPAFSGPYEIDPLRSQYLLYHVVGALVTVLTGDAALANKLLLVAVVAAFPLSFRALLRAAGRDERLALFACLPFYSRPLAIGFLPFVASLPVLFAGLALVFRQASARSRTRKGAVALSAVAVVLFYVHVSAWLLFVASAVAILGSVALGETMASPHGSPASRARDLARSLAGRLLWLVPAAAAAGAWALAGRLSAGASLSDPGEIGQMRLSRSLLALPRWVFDVWHAHGDEAAAVAWWSAFTVAAVATSRRGFGRLPLPAILVRYVPLAVTLVAFVVTPFRVGVAAALTVRLAPAIVLLALLPLRLPRGRPRAVALLMLLVANLTGAVTAIVESRRAVEEELGDLGSLVAKIPRGARLVTLVFDQQTRVLHVMPWLHAGAYHRVANGGVAMFSFSELVHWPLHFRPEARPPRKPIFWWELAPCLYRNAEDGRYYDAVLVRGAQNPFVDEPPGPVFRAVARAGPNTLWLRDASGATWPDWKAADRGPCVPRSDVERAGQAEEASPP